jgi:putative peptide zinc metalloprotease protein
MEHYSAATRVTVRPFAQHREAGTVTIGDPDRQVYLSIPEEALDILNWLAEGLTVAETLRSYEQKYGETPDIEDFIDGMAEEGFIVVGADGAVTDDMGAEMADAAATPKSSTGHLARISPALAQRVLGPPVLAGCALVVLGALIMIASDPAVVPGPSVLVFPRYLAPISVGMFLFGLAGVALHEMGHLLAARAAGVPARFGVGHRLWVLVAETDMTGIWMAPKRDRYKAFLAGPLVDAVSASVLVAFLWTLRHGWFALSPLQTQVAGAALMVYLLRLLWEFFLFVRTDLYYVFAAAFDCKNLLGDTEVFIRNQVARVVRSRRTVDQSTIPSEEMRVVRWYSVVWLLGRAAALCVLSFITLPVMWRYGAAIAPMLSGGSSRYGFVDILALGAVTVGVEGAGLVSWLRGLARAKMERRSDAMATS